ncbi:hypothetical protein AAFF_G00413240 [Aldrovandia affinis]|uniref:Uncharacterized protein n=1 Tax=Aldrovandia affinis TaxID=143900 RepID=A0AAD7SB01_9TELE|nr:hypothetical protein AAFF_G00413240 [Aldrovandia affinis]
MVHLWIELLLPTSSSSSSSSPSLLHLLAVFLPAPRPVTVTDVHHLPASSQTRDAPLQLAFTSPQAASWARPSLPEIEAKSRVDQRLRRCSLAR